jgi:hypothetical protein
VTPDPLFDGIQADLFFTAPQSDRQLVEELIAAVGLRPAYLGENQHISLNDRALALARLYLGTVAYSYR